MHIRITSVRIGVYSKMTINACDIYFTQSCNLASFLLYLKGANTSTAARINTHTKTALKNTSPYSKKKQKNKSLKTTDVLYLYGTDYVH